MTDVEKQKQMEQIKQSEDGMRQTVLLIKIGLMVFLTFACCIVFFFLVLQGTRGLQIPGICYRCIGTDYYRTGTCLSAYPVNEISGAALAADF